MAPARAVGRRTLLASRSLKWACRCAWRGCCPGAGLPSALIALPAGAHGGGCRPPRAPANTWGMAADELGAGCPRAIALQIEATPPRWRSGRGSTNCQAAGRRSSLLRWASSHGGWHRPPRGPPPAHRTREVWSAPGPGATAGGIAADRATNGGSARPGRSGWDRRQWARASAAVLRRRRSSLGKPRQSGRHPGSGAASLPGLQPHQRTQAPAGAARAQQRPASPHSSWGAAPEKKTAALQARAATPGKARPSSRAQQRTVGEH